MGNHESGNEFQKVQRSPEKGIAANLPSKRPDISQSDIEPV